MNAWGLVLIALALVLIVIAAKGSQVSVWEAITGKTYTGTSKLVQGKF